VPVPGLAPELVTGMASVPVTELALVPELVPEPPSGHRQPSAE